MQNLKGNVLEHLTSRPVHFNILFCPIFFYCLALRTLRSNSSRQYAHWASSRGVNWEVRTNWTRGRSRTVTVSLSSLFTRPRESPRCHDEQTLLGYRKQIDLLLFYSALLLIRWELVNITLEINIFMYSFFTLWWSFYHKMLKFNFVHYLLQQLSSTNRCGISSLLNGPGGLMQTLFSTTFIRSFLRLEMVIFPSSELATQANQKIIQKICAS